MLNATCATCLRYCTLIDNLDSDYHERNSVTLQHNLLDALIEHRQVCEIKNPSLMRFSEEDNIKSLDIRSLYDVNKLD